MQMPGRQFAAEEYRYGFQGQEEDDEFLGGAVSYKYRVHDTRIGRFLSLDPLAPDYPHNSPYAFSENVVISHVELEGLEKAEATTKYEYPIQHGEASIVAITGQTLESIDIEEELEPEVSIGDAANTVPEGSGMGYTLEVGTATSLRDWNERFGLDAGTSLTSAQSHWEREFNLYKFKYSPESRGDYSSVYSWLRLSPNLPKTVNQLRSAVIGLQENPVNHEKDDDYY